MLVYLIADDRQTIRHIASRILDDTDFVNLSSRDDLEAMKEYGQSPTDIVVLDAHMPVITVIKSLLALRWKKGGGNGHNVLFCASRSSLGFFQASHAPRAEGSRTPLEKSLAMFSLGDTTGCGEKNQ
jgi:CheY-like chemotaxis protein